MGYVISGSVAALPAAIALTALQNQQKENNVQIAQMPHTPCTMHYIQG